MQLDVQIKVSLLKKLNSRMSMRAKHVYNTWRGSLDDDVNRVLGQLSVKDFGELGGCFEFLALRFGDLIDEDGTFFIIVVLVRNGDAPQVEHVRVDITESDSLFGLDEFLEVANCFHSIPTGKAFDIHQQDSTGSGGCRSWWW